MKKAYAKTQIQKFLDDKEAEGNMITINYVRTILPDIYQMLIEDPEKPITGCTYDEFMFWVNHGYARAMMGV